MLRHILNLVGEVVTISTEHAVESSAKASPNTRLVTFAPSLFPPNMINETPIIAMSDPIASDFVSFSLQKSIAKNIVNNGDVQL